jgi:hypothetical protein
MRKLREHGAATAEYTIGTLGTVFIAFWLSRFALGDPDQSWFGRFIHRLITDAFEDFGGHNWVWRWLM